MTEDTLELQIRNYVCMYACLVGDLILYDHIIGDDAVTHHYYYVYAHCVIAKCSLVAVVSCFSIQWRYS